MLIILVLHMKKIKVVYNTVVESEFGSHIPVLIYWSE